jgi:hypothetical protein
MFLVLAISSFFFCKLHSVLDGAGTYHYSQTVHSKRKENKKKHNS